MAGVNSSYIGSGKPSHRTLQTTVQREGIDLGQPRDFWADLARMRSTLPVRSMVPRYAGPSVIPGPQMQAQALRGGSGGGASWVRDIIPGSTPGVQSNFTPSNMSRWGQAGEGDVGAVYGGWRPDIGGSGGGSSQPNLYAPGGSNQTQRLYDPAPDDARQQQRQAAADDAEGGAKWW